MTKPIASLTHKILARHLKVINDLENEQYEMYIKYRKLVKFTKIAYSKSCDLLDPCTACEAKATLIDIGEWDA